MLLVVVALGEVEKLLFLDKSVAVGVCRRTCPKRVVEGGDRDSVAGQLVANPTSAS